MQNNAVSRGGFAKYVVQRGKTVLSTKKCGKVKTGLQDWNYSKKVRCFCKAENSRPIASNFASTSENILPDGLAAPDYSNCGIRIHSRRIRKYTGEGE